MRPLLPNYGGEGDEVVRLRRIADEAMTVGRQKWLGKHDAQGVAFGRGGGVEWLGGPVCLIEPGVARLAKH